MSKLELLHDMLIELAYLEPNQWKQRAYKNAASILMDKGEESFNRRNRFADIPGIGSGIEKKILEFKTTGTIAKLNELRLKYPNKLDPKYYKVRKGYVTKRIPLSEAYDLYDKLVELIGLPKDKLTLCGSARRRVPLVGDIDVVISTSDHNFLNKLRNKLSSHYKVTVGGDRKLSFIINEVTKTPCDLYVTDVDQYWPMVCYLTGSQNFNIKLRGKAKSKGLLLNQYGLFDKDGKALPIRCEEDIFNALDMKYVDPKNRNI